MKKIISSIFEIIFAICGLIFGISLARSLSVTYERHLSAFWGNMLKFNLLFSALFLLISLALLTVIVLRSQEKVKLGWMQRIASEFLILFLIFLGMISYKFEHLEFQLSANRLTAASFESGLTFYFVTCLIYTLGLFSFLEILERLRDRRFASSLYWKQFFSLYREKKLLLTSLGALLLGNLLYFPVSTWLWYMLSHLDFYSQVFSNMRSLVSQPQLFNFTMPANSIQSLQFLFSMSASTLISYGQNIYYFDFVLSFFVLFSFAVMTYFVTFVLHLSEKYDLANQEKIQAERFKTELITNVSHDMKTPLTSIINYVGLLENKNLSLAERENYLEILDQKSDRLKYLLSDLLEASKARSGNVTMNMETINLSEYLGQILGEFDEDFESKNLQLSYHQPANEVSVSVDSEHLRRILENILINALKYSQENTRVIAKISVIEENQKVCLQLFNTSSEPIDFSGEALTEQFVRVDQSRKSEGSGLGLYIAKTLSELMGIDFKVNVAGDQFEVKLVFHSLKSLNFLSS